MTTESDLVRANWVHFCRRLQSAGERLLEAPGVSEPQMPAESLRFLVRELRSALEWEVDTADPDRPHFLRADDSGSGPPAPNLDNQYLHARIRAGARYRVTFDSRSIFDVLIGVTDPKWTHYGDHSLEEFAADADGTVELTIGGPQLERNWIPIPDPGTLLGIRIYYHDWDRDRPPVPRIECLDAVRPGPVLDALTLGKRLGAAADWLETRPFLYPALQTRWIDSHPVNTVPEPLPMPGGGGPIRYGCGRFRLSRDEALIVECAAPKARYWGFHLYVAPWFSPIDPLDRLTSLNDRQLQLDADGRVRVVVAARDPGVPNWLDTAGFVTGAFYYRWIWTQDAPEIGTQVVRLDEVRQHLPVTTPVFTPADREQQMRRRREHLGHRFKY